MELSPARQVQPAWPGPGGGDGGSPSGGVVMGT